MLYGVFGLGDDLSKIERAKKAYKLYLSSANKGNEDAVMTVISIFEHGEPMIGVEKNNNVASCLQKEIDNGLKIDHVQSCLKNVIK